ncbi:MAG: hypothetical protein WBX03_06975, partial [Terriglobales bacterium]
MRRERFLQIISRTLAILAITLILGSSAEAASYKTLVTFTGKNGSEPYLPLTFDAAGNLYGATSYGGTYDAGLV